ncbi:siderophore ABC transporter substrate-binding protein [uncultured Tessaracoccus sp.]|uniref:siderophore ABC transporter substrate-binding protein n=1 Tax=uncultured Tessaracoccus sp. TaxID=905023 RepID=UPI0026212FFE|nr:ABC transporter substrate-binding protein [uncultured Tessaracoccus sp.]
MKLQRLAALVAAGLVGLAACSPSSSESTTPSTQPSASNSATQVTDARGTVDVPANPQHIVATDNRIFQTLQAWDVKLVAAPKKLISSNNPYKNDDSIVDLGNHREPDLEAIVATKPDLILNGQRFAQHYDAIKKLTPDAALVDTDISPDKPLDEELKRQTTLLGDIFGKQNEAKQLNADLDAAIKRVKDANKSSEKFMAVITSGGEINYAAPGKGRTLGPVFKVLGLTPALETDGSSDHTGDDISVEAIAQSNPDWILVMDRDAAVSANNGEKYTPANELLKESAALKNVTAVKKNQIVYMPQDTYLDESIQTYTKYFNELADAMEKA